MRNMKIISKIFVVVFLVLVVVLFKITDKNWGMIKGNTADTKDDVFDKTDILKVMSNEETSSKSQKGTEMELEENMNKRVDNLPLFSEENATTKENVFNSMKNGADEFLEISSIKQWQTVIHNKYGWTYIFTRAWLDTREDLDDTPCLRIFVIYPINLFSIIKENVQHTGVVTFNNTEYKLNGYVGDLLNHRSRKVNRIHYRRSSLIFKLPFKLDSDSLYLLERKLAYRASDFQAKVNEIYIMTPYRKTYQGGTFICSRSLYGHFTKERINFLVEWIEMNKLLGVKEIHIYNASLINTPTIEKLFKYYKEQEFVYLHQINVPFQSLDTNSQTDEMDAATLTDAAILNDCYYSNMNQHDYVIVLDTDELIIPVNDDNYTSLINNHLHSKMQLNNVSTISAFWGMFYNATSDSKLSKILSYEKYIVLKKGKSFTSTKKCPVIGQHYCALVDPKYTMHKYVDPKIMITHHYRSSCAKPQFCKPNATTLVAKHVNKYQSELKPRLTQMYDMLNV